MISERMMQVTEALCIVLLSRVCVCAWTREIFWIQNGKSQQNTCKALEIEFVFTFNAKQIYHTKKQQPKIMPFTSEYYDRIALAQYHFKLCAMCVNEKRKQSISMAWPESCECSDEQRICLQI